MAQGSEGRHGTLDYWRQQLSVLRREDWDRRVRISAGNREGARVGSVAQVPPVGIKLALREAMHDRARAEIAYLETLERLRALQARRMARTWGSFAAGGVVVAVAAVLGRLWFG